MKLEDEHHRLAIAIDEARSAATDLAPMRQRQIELLLEITSIVAEIRDATTTTTEDLMALPMTARLLRALAGVVPGFEFNSLRRWLSLPGQFEQLMGAKTPNTPARDENGAIGFGEP